MRRTVEIAPFLRRHLDRVMEIEHVSFAEDAYPREMFVDLYHECPGLFFVARCSRRIIGYSVAALKGTAAEIVSIAVAPEHRGEGVGRALMRHTIGRLKRRHVRTLTLVVKVGNEEAIGLYGRLGLRLVGRIPRYYEDRSDGLLMQKKL